jgi:hypothetical protein
MKTQIENITTIAANLIISGKATPENAIEKAIELDSNKCLEVIEDINDMKRGYINTHNKTQKAFNILLKSVYEKLA